MYKNTYMHIYVFTNIIYFKHEPNNSMDYLMIYYNYHTKK